MNRMNTVELYRTVILRMSTCYKIKTAASDSKKPKPPLPLCASGLIDHCSTYGYMYSLCIMARLRPKLGAAPGWGVYHQRFLAVGLATYIQFFLESMKKNYASTGGRGCWHSTIERVFLGERKRKVAYLYASFARRRDGS